jgi:hypothetical protein
LTECNYIWPSVKNSPNLTSVGRHSLEPTKQTNNFFPGGENNLGGLSQAIRGTAQLMEQGVGTMSKFQGMLSGK